MTFTKLRDIKPKNIALDKYVSREFQQYGYDLAMELGEPKKVSLYIKLAKENPRGLLESARAFVRDAVNVKSKGRLYLWKLKQLKEQANKKG
ncbi:MAG: hypothetical protein N2558_03490 [Patescibacteria group bacterium]|nr:hypothetical protein [Patescibacteria group bacterium]